MVVVHKSDLTGGKFLGGRSIKALSGISVHYPFVNTMAVMGFRGIIIFPVVYQSRCVAVVI